MESGKVLIEGGASSRNIRLSVEVRIDSAYYFIRKFYKEMGIKVSDYIKQARIEYAKVVLVTSKKSIQEISDLLQFGTRNYFSKVFHEVVGMMPAAYREKTGSKGEQE